MVLGLLHIVCGIVTYQHHNNERKMNDASSRARYVPGSRERFKGSDASSSVKWTSSFSLIFLKFSFIRVRRCSFSRCSPARALVEVTDPEQFNNAHVYWFPEMKLKFVPCDDQAKWLELYMKSK